MSSKLVKDIESESSSQVEEDRPVSKSSMSSSSMSSKDSKPSKSQKADAKKELKAEKAKAKVDKKARKERVKKEYQALEKFDQKYENGWYKFWRIIALPDRYRKLNATSKKLKKWMKKSAKQQDPNLYTFKEKWLKLVKSAKNLQKMFNIDYEINGIDNFMPGAQIIVANHLSNLDVVALVHAAEENRHFTFVAKQELANSQWEQYMRAVDAFYIDRSDVRQAVAMIDLAAQYAKNNNRGIVIFPEGTRSTNADGKNVEVNEFSTAAVAVAKKYFIPVLPVTIEGTKWAEEHLMDRSEKKVTITFHKLIKPVEIAKQNAVNITDKVRSEIISGLSYSRKAELVKTNSESENTIRPKHKGQLPKFSAGKKNKSSSKKGK